jgi:hypothetical protein
VNLSRFQITDEVIDVLAVHCLVIPLAGGVDPGTLGGGKERSDRQKVGRSFPFL